jgi:hypothetical protein
MECCKLLLCAEVSSCQQLEMHQEWVKAFCQEQLDDQGKARC